MRPASVLASLLAAAVLALSGCSVSTTSCNAVRCSATVTGEKSIDISLGNRDRTLHVGPIGQRGVALSVLGAEQVVPAGSAVVMGGLRIGVVRIDGNTVELDVTRA
ncbi:hypothetical protein SAMN05443637_101421 [Pseudonocardia thermophila]|uniref:Uncharacterized protein n=1 Tax=Pseudonocardia thermophila TaxID=1848 RepID=A0A1M6NRH6_PSETH|nr:hypothetical protein [Pseudonocardia thermophila]SHJ98226.1 hypothetical protein SAMN05443637_101421 [Pseudonocardia thermophila]